MGFHLPQPKLLCTIVQLFLTSPPPPSSGLVKEHPWVEVKKEMFTALRSFFTRFTAGRKSNHHHRVTLQWIGTNILSTTKQISSSLFSYQKDILQNWVKNLWFFYQNLKQLSSERFQERSFRGNGVNSRANSDESRQPGFLSQRWNTIIINIIVIIIVTVVIIIITIRTLSLLLAPHLKSWKTAWTSSRRPWLSAGLRTQSRGWCWWWW